MTIRHLPILLALLAAALVGTVAPPPARAADPCWKRLIQDWYDGRIDNVYPVKCYRAAIKHLPEDVQAYSTAREDIQRALLASIRQTEKSGGKVSPNDPVPAETGTNTTSTDSLAAGSSGGGGGGVGNDDGAGGDGLGGVLKPANATSVPLPLLVLAGLALLLLAAASAGFVARRVQARRVRVSSVPPNRKNP